MNWLNNAQAGATRLGVLFLTLSAALPALADGGTSPGLGTLGAIVDWLLRLVG